MRDLAKTKHVRSWFYGDLKHSFAEIREGKRGAKYFCLWITYTVPGLMGSAEQTKTGIRDVRDLHLDMLQDAAKRAVEIADAYSLSAEWLESLLDFIFLELNRRLNKVVE